MKFFCFDLDGTICTEERTFRKQYARPHSEMIKLINDLYNMGHHIIIFSGRQSLEWQATVEWLAANNIKYHQLILNKPFFDYYVCDKAVLFDANEGADNIRKRLKLD